MMINPLHWNRDLHVMIEELTDLGLQGMADTLQEILSSPEEEYKNWDWESVLTELIASQQQRILDDKGAKFLENSNIPVPNADLADVAVDGDVDDEVFLFNEICRADWVDSHSNLILAGSVSAECTHAASAISAYLCLHHTIEVRYATTGTFLQDLWQARCMATYEKVMMEYARWPLLVLDEFCLFGHPTERQLEDILTLIELRHGAGSIIFCSDSWLSDWPSFPCPSAKCSSMWKSIRDMLTGCTFMLELGNKPYLHSVQEYRRSCKALKKDT